ncbi:hypothetical protein [Pelagibius sp.]|uniref:hypothetical protein n=1 Tax=Pelagibius sp. TaxID=1931238 RepID=UPI003BAFF717
MAEKNATDLYQEGLKEVARREDGSPIVLSPYGFRIMEIDGEKFIVSRTKEEADRVLEEISKEAGKQVEPCYMRDDGGCRGNCPNHQPCRNSTRHNMCVCGW